MQLKCSLRISLQPLQRNETGKKSPSDRFRNEFLLHFISQREKENWIQGQGEEWLEPSVYLPLNILKYFLHYNYMVDKNLLASNSLDLMDMWYFKYQFQTEILFDINTFIKMIKATATVKCSCWISEYFILNVSDCAKFLFNSCKNITNKHYYLKNRMIMQIWQFVEKEKSL